MLGGVALRALFRFIAIITVILVIIPALIVGIWGWLTPPPSVLDSPYEIAVYITSTSQVVTMPLEEYVIGVVAGEMPASFAPAALQAQATAARTYAVRRAIQFGGAGCSKHGLADICDDPAHCQAFLPPEALQLKWGLVSFNEYYARISNAVQHTAGQIITYRGQIIDPIFHSTCGGSTEDADKVWSNYFPYLVSVECGYCSHSARFVETKTLSHTDFLAALKAQDGAIAVTAQQLAGKTPPFEISTRSASQRVLEVSVGSRKLRGTEFRAALGLNSSNFEVEIAASAVLITTTGYGHGVGLCQYGADGMAKAGFDYKQILEHYYRGVHITNLNAGNGSGVSKSLAEGGLKHVLAVS